MTLTTSSPPSSKRVTRRPSRTRTTTTEDIPVFDRNKVTLDLPSELLGSSVSLIITSSKIVGSVIQNTAERYRTFLGLFRPLFKGAFAIKGLDPPTTTTVRPPRKSTRPTKSLDNTINPKEEINEIK